MSISFRRFEILLPLQFNDDPEIPLDLGKVFSEAYDHAAYDLSIDYRRDPVPPLADEDRRWANKLLRERSLR